PDLRCCRALSDEEETETRQKVRCRSLKSKVAAHSPMKRRLKPNSIDTISASSNCCRALSDEEETETPSGTGTTDRYTVWLTIAFSGITNWDGTCAKVNQGDNAGNGRHAGNGCAPVRERSDYRVGAGASCFDCFGGAAPVAPGLKSQQYLCDHTTHTI